MFIVQVESIKNTDSTWLTIPPGAGGISSSDSDPEPLAANSIWPGAVPDRPELLLGDRPLTPGRSCGPGGLMKLCWVVLPDDGSFKYF